MILCAGVIVIRTIMDDTIKSEEDIEKYLGLSSPFISVTFEKSIVLLSTLGGVAV